MGHRGPHEEAEEALRLKERLGRVGEIWGVQAEPPEKKLSLDRGSFGVTRKGLSSPGKRPRSGLEEFWGAQEEFEPLKND